MFIQKTEDERAAEIEAQKRKVSDLTDMLPKSSILAMEGVSDKDLKLEAARRAALRHLLVLKRRKKTVEAHIAELYTLDGAKESFKKRVERWNRIHALHELGKTWKEVSKEVDLSVGQIARLMRYRNGPLRAIGILDSDGSINWSKWEEREKARIASNLEWDRMRRAQ